MTSRDLFNHAIEVVLEHEGDTLTDLPADHGGPTKFGISQRWNPDVNVCDLTREQAIEIYWERYWKDHKYEWLPEPIAVKLFDLAVNLGAEAVRCLQQALRACGHPVKVDGVLGPKTASAAHDAGSVVLLASLRSEAACAYRHQASSDPSQGVFLSGWLARAYA